MTRTMTLMTIAALSLVATPVVVNATSTTPRPAQAVAVTPAAMVVATTTPKGEDQPACTRKVRVVYAGLGEGAQGCATPVAQR